MSDFTLTASAVTGEQSYNALRTVTFKSVLWGAARLCGWKPETRDLTAERAAQLTEFINERVREAWEYAVWPDLRAVEERYYHQGLWSSGNYAEGAIVYHAGTEAYYTADTGTSEEPSAAASDWTATSSYSKLIPWEQLDQLKLGNVELVQKSDPRVNRTPTDLSFKQVDREGFYVTDSLAGTSVWLTWLRREPEFSSTAHVAATPYGLGDITYWPGDGECYVSLSSNNAVADPSADEAWDRAEFPYAFASFVKRAAYADWLMSQDREKQADKQDAKARSRLDDLLNRQGVQGQLPMTRVISRGAAVQ